MLFKNLISPIKTAPHKDIHIDEQTVRKNYRRKLKSMLVKHLISSIKKAPPDKKKKIDIQRGKKKIVEGMLFKNLTSPIKTAPLKNTYR